MKKNWQAPRILVQEFEANEYVATCYQLYCAISGDGKGGVEHESIKFNWRQKWNNDQWTIYPDGKNHGAPCAAGSSYYEDKGIFYENSKPASLVSALDIGDPVNDGSGRVYAKWVSTDGGPGNTGNYNHYGYAIETVDRPNHS